MAIARPTSDISAGANWTSTGASFYTEIDDVTSDQETTKIQHTVSGVSTVVEVKFAPVTDPQSSVGHSIYMDYRHIYDFDLLLTLYQGTTALHGGFPVFSTGGVWNFGLVGTLSGAEADAITDYSDLRVRISSGKDSLAISQVYLQVPDPAGKTRKTIRSKARHRASRW